MSRHLRLEFASALYHVTARCNELRNIFRPDSSSASRRSQRDVMARCRGLAALSRTKSKTQIVLTAALAEVSHAPSRMDTAKRQGSLLKQGRQKGIAREPPQSKQLARIETIAEKPSSEKLAQFSAMANDSPRMAALRKDADIDSVKLQHAARAPGREKKSPTDVSISIDSSIFHRDTSRAQKDECLALLMMRDKGQIGAIAIHSIEVIMVNFRKEAGV